MDERQGIPRRRARSRPAIRARRNTRDERTTRDRSNIRARPELRPPEPALRVLLSIGILSHEIQSVEKVSLSALDIKVEVDDRDREGCNKVNEDMSSRKVFDLEKGKHPGGCRGGAIAQHVVCGYTWGLKPTTGTIERWEKVHLTC